MVNLLTSFYIYIYLLHFIYIARQQTKKIKGTRFREKGTKGKICFKSHKKIKSDIRVKRKFFFFKEGAALRFLSQENKNLQVSLQGCSENKR